MPTIARRCRTRKVLVLGTDARVVLAVVRSLGRHNLRVHVGWCPAGSPALCSRYIAQIHEIPPYRADNDAWKDSLTATVRQHHFDLVLPCDDSTLAPLQRHRRELEGIAPIYLPPAGPGKEVPPPEPFRGTAVSVEMLADHGEVLAAFQHVRIPEAIAGAGASRRSAPLHPGLLDAAKESMKAIDYTGLATIDAIVNSETGQWVIRQIHGRFWGSLPLAVAAGADFPYYLYQLWVQGKRNFPASYRQDVRCGDRLLASFARDDLRPALAELRIVVRRLCRKLGGRCLAEADGFNGSGRNERNGEGFGLSGFGGI